MQLKPFLKRGIIIFIFLMVINPTFATDLFKEVSRLENPLRPSIKGVKEGNNLVFVDFDKDGDFDAIIGEREEKDYQLNYYENVGTPTQPAFEARSDEVSPFVRIDLSSLEKTSPSTFPIPADLDADGDFDLLLGVNGREIFYYENEGYEEIENTPVLKFKHSTGSENPFNGIDLSGADSHADTLCLFCQSSLILLDFDRDTDLDLFVGYSDGTVSYYQNTGNKNTPVFKLSPSPLAGVSVELPALVDIDADGDFDIFSGGYANRTDNPYQGGSFFHENRGEALQAKFVERTGDKNPLGVRGYVEVAPAFVDIDGDGDLDVFIIDRFADSIIYYENVGTVKQPQFIDRADKINPFGWINSSFAGGPLGSRANPSWGDMDDDGDFDVFLETGSGIIGYYENSGKATAPEFTQRLGDANPLENTMVYSTLTLVDIDKDGDLDAFSGGLGVFSGKGQIQRYENSGTRQQAEFTWKEDSLFPLLEMSLAKLTFGDMDADGDFDAFIFALTEQVGPTYVIPTYHLYFYENTGSANQPLFLERSGIDNPLNSITDDIVAEPECYDYVPNLTLVDSDYDGDLDAFLGSHDGSVGFYANTGTPKVPHFVNQTDSAQNPFFMMPRYSYMASETGGDCSKPSFVDIDNDGDKDAFIGIRNGSLRFFENQGIPTNDSNFVHRTGRADPLNSIPLLSLDDRINDFILADFDSDGDFDLFIQTNKKTFYHENQGDITTPKFKATPVELSLPLPTDDEGYNSFTLGDLDGDADLDIFYLVTHYFADGTTTFSSYYAENKGDLNFVLQPDAQNPLQAVKSNLTRLVDIDNDSDLDVFALVAGDYRVDYYENTGTRTNPHFVKHEDYMNPLRSIFIPGDNPDLEFKDIDNDGDLDLFFYDFDVSKRGYYENTGNAQKPKFTQRAGADSFVAGVIYESIELVDMDNDGDLDAFASGGYDEHGNGLGSTSIRYYENVNASSAIPYGDSFNQPRDVTLRCTDCVKIYYTLDGTEPTLNSTEYTTPIRIERDTTLKFIKVNPAGQISKIQTHKYVIDTQAPTVKITDPVTDTMHKSIPAISGTVSDASSGLDRVELRITDGELFLTDDEQNPFSATPTHLSVTSDGESWSYDTSKVPFPQSKTYTLTAKTFDKVGNLSEDTITVTIGELAYTTLSLTLNSQTILQNDTLAVTGKLQRLPDIGVDLAGETVELTVTAPDGTSTTRTTTTDKLGNYVFHEVTGFIQKGAYALKTTFQGSEMLSPVQSVEQSVLVGTFAGYAILVQGKIPNQEGLDAHNKTLNRVYRKLKERGFVNENIRYFNYNPQQDSDHDGKNDIFAVPAKSEIQNSIETWLRERTNGVSAPLYLIMIDHGSPNAFLVENDKITPEELNNWLTTLENGLTEVARQEPRILILGACYSGSFIPALSKPGRLIISSAAEDEESYKGPLEEDGIRSGEFFIEEFFQQLGQGDSFKAAFEQATRRTEIFTRQGNLSANTANRFLDDAVQHPLLDDNGDGVGSNVLLAKDDGQWANSLFLGAGLDFNTNDFLTSPAYIVAVTPTQFLSETETHVRLSLQASVSRKVDPASLEIRPPSKQLTSQKGTEQLNIDLDSKFLTFNQETGLFEVDYANFVEHGRYEIFYTVRDADTQDLAPIKRSVVYKNRPDNQPPRPFQLVSPADRDAANRSEVQTVLILDWENTTDPDQDPFGYTVVIAKDPDLEKVIYQAEELNTSMLPIDGSVLGDLTQYYWRVEAIDGFGARTASDIFTFKTNNNVNVPPNISSLNVVSALDFTALESATVTVNDIPAQPNVYADQGRYDLLLPSGDYRATVTVPGFQPQTVTLNAQPEIAQQNIVLLPSNDVVLLPDLQMGMAINKENQFITVNTRFKGGIAVNGSVYRANTAVRLTDSVVIKGEITVDPAHVGQLADLVVVAGYTPLTGGAEQFFMLGAGNTLLPWDMDIKQLVAHQPAVNLTANQLLEIYSGRFTSSGQLKIFYGYRLADGTVVFNNSQMGVRIN